MAMPARFAASTTSATLSGPPMLPGLMRTAATPASIAFRASEALKWMSAITGSGERRTIFASASASSVLGTAQRTISQPADASAAICAVVASTSWVFVSVIDCTTTGAPPPMATPPTRICSTLGIPGSVETALASKAHPTAMQERPPPTRWALERPPDDHPHDVWALGADLEAGTLIAAYELGLFPMAVDERLVWWSPQARAVLPLRGLPRVPLAATVGAALRDPGRHRVRAGDACLRRPVTPGRLDRRCVRLRLRRAAPPRLRPLGRGVGRGRPPGRRLRRRDRRALRRRVQVPPAHRRLQGRAARSRAACSAPRTAPTSVSSTCSGRRPTWPPSAPSRSRGPSTTGAWTPPSDCPTPSRWLIGDWGATGGGHDQAAWRDRARLVPVVRALHERVAMRRVVAVSRVCPNCRSTIYGRAEARPAYERRPMSFVSPMKNSTSTRPMPTIEMRS